LSTNGEGKEKTGLSCASLEKKGGKALRPTIRKEKRIFRVSHGFGEDCPKVSRKKRKIF